MKTTNRLQTLSISLCLVILALGFATLGLASFASHQSNCSETLFSAENTYSLIGSTFSVLVGAAFLVAAITCRGLKVGSVNLVAGVDGR